MAFRKQKNLCVLIHLQQDLDLLLPMLRSLKAQQRNVVCLVYGRILKKSPRIRKTLHELQIPWISVRSPLDYLKALWILVNSHSVISAVETNVPAHRFAYQLTRIANFFGKKTWTLQHGLENIGLTYSDQEYPISTVSFASQKILLWSNLSQLHPDISLETKAKCVSFGCPKEYAPRLQYQKPAGAQRIVAVFENMHWSRYSPEYRNFFVDTLIKTAHAFPQIHFLLKPHHAGQWWTKRSTLKLQIPSNLKIIDPTDPLWEPYTGPDIIHIADAVITTPSTIAYDASALDKVTFVVGYQLKLPVFEPLPIITSEADWMSALESLSNKTGTHEVQLKAFLAKNNSDPHCVDKFREILF